MKTIFRPVTLLGFVLFFLPADARAADSSPGGPALRATTALTLVAESNQAPCFGKMEFVIRGVPRCQDPFNPAEVDLRVEITTPQGKRILVPAFYIQPYEHRRVGRGTGREWLYPVGEAEWRARYAPTAPGPHQGAAILKTPLGTSRSAGIGFDATASTRHGFVRVAKRDARYFEFDDGSPFFVVGQNVAFVKDGFQSMEMIRRLGANGGNFARVWICSEDWALAIEARRSGWGRSWDWRPPFVMMPDRDSYHSGRLCLQLGGEGRPNLRYEPTRPLAVRPGARYVFSGEWRGSEGARLTVDLAGSHSLESRRGWTPFQIEVASGSNEWFLAGPVFRCEGAGVAWLRHLSLREAGDGPELLIEADPNLPATGRYHQADGALVDRLLETAEQSGVHLQLVLLTRDHYLSRLKREGSSDYEAALAEATKLVRYCAARWGYSTHLSAWEYFNEIDPGLPLTRFHAGLARALDEFDPNRHLRTTSAWHSPAPHYADPSLDQADMHFYLRPPNGERWKDEVASIQSCGQIMREKVRGKPSVFAEFGITDANWQRAPQLDQDRDFVHLHHALWTSALSGFATTVCHWYWDDIQRRDLYPVYRPLARFVADIPFNAGGIRPVQAKSDDRLRVIGLQNDAGAWLWIVHTNATWWRIALDGIPPSVIADAALILDGLTAGGYEIQWWDTRQGVVTGTVPIQLGDSPVKVTIPAFTGDIAAKVRRRGAGGPGVR